MHTLKRQKLNQYQKQPSTNYEVETLTQRTNRGGENVSQKLEKSQYLSCNQDNKKKLMPCDSDEISDEEGVTDHLFSQMSVTHAATLETRTLTSPCRHDDQDTKRQHFACQNGRERSLNLQNQPMLQTVLQPKGMMQLNQGMEEHNTKTKSVSPNAIKNILLGNYNTRNPKERVFVDLSNVKVKTVSQEGQPVRAAKISPQGIQQSNTLNPSQQPGDLNYNETSVIQSKPSTKARRGHNFSFMDKNADIIQLDKVSSPSYRQYLRGGFDSSACNFENSPPNETNSSLRQPNKLIRISEEEQPHLGVRGANSIPVLPKTDEQETVEVYQTTVTDRLNSMQTLENQANHYREVDFADVISQLSHSNTRADDISYQNQEIVKHIGLESDLSRLHDTQLQTCDRKLEKSLQQSNSQNSLPTSLFPCRNGVTAKPGVAWTSREGQVLESGLFYLQSKNEEQTSNKTVQTVYLEQNLQVPDYGIASPQFPQPPTERSHQITLDDIESKECSFGKMPREFTDGQKSAFKVIREEQNEYQIEQDKCQELVNDQIKRNTVSKTHLGNSKPKESRNSDISPEYRSVQSMKKTHQESAKKSVTSAVSDSSHSEAFVVLSGQNLLLTPLRQQRKLQGSSTAKSASPSSQKGPGSNQRRLRQRSCSGKFNRHPQTSMFQVKEENEEAHEEAPTPREYDIEAVQPLPEPKVTSPEMNRHLQSQQDQDCKNHSVNQDQSIVQATSQLHIHELSQGLDGVQAYFTQSEQAYGNLKSMLTSSLRGPAEIESKQSSTCSPYKLQSQTSLSLRQYCSQIQPSTQQENSSQYATSVCEPIEKEPQDLTKAPKKVGSGCQSSEQTPRRNQLSKRTPPQTKRTPRVERDKSPLSSYSNPRSRTRSQLSERVMTPVLSANGRKTPIKNHEPTMPSARQSVGKASVTQSIPSTLGSAFKQSITNVKMPGQAQTNIPDLYSQIAKQQRQKSIKKGELMARKTQKKGMPALQGKYANLDNIQIQKPQSNKRQIISLPVINAIYSDDLSERDIFRTLEVQENRQFLCLTTLMTESSQLLNLASNHSDQKSGNLAQGEFPVPDLGFHDISKIQYTRGQRSTNIFSPDLSRETSPSYSTARDLKNETDFTGKSSQSSVSRAAKKKRLNKVCKVDQLIQIFQEQPSPVKMQKSVNELIKENMNSKESTLKEYKEFLKDESFSPRMGKITNKLRSESKEALEKKLKQQKKPKQESRPLTPQVNYTTPRKKQIKPPFRSVFAYAPQPQQTSQVLTRKRQNFAVRQNRRPQTQMSTDEPQQQPQKSLHSHVHPATVRTTKSTNKSKPRFK